MAGIKDVAREGLTSTLKTRHHNDRDFTRRAQCDFRCLGAFSAADPLRGGFSGTCSSGALCGGGNVSPATSAGQFDSLHGGGKKRRAVSDGSGSPSDGTVL